MTELEELFNRYIAYAKLHGKGVNDGDSELTNKNYELLNSTYKQISEVDGFEKPFTELLSSTNDSVLMCVA